MKEVIKTVINPNGIHARPAANFVKAAQNCQSKITVENMKTGKQKDAKSIFGVMSLAMCKGTQIRITAEGPDEDEAIQRIGDLVDSGLGEL